MPSTQQGLVYKQNAIYGGKTFYALLTNTVMSLNSDMTAAVAGEVSGGGYVRLPLTFEGASVDSAGFSTIVSQTVVLTATGAAIGPFRCLCIVTAAAGTSGTVLDYQILVNAANPTQGITIQSGASYQIAFPVQQKTG